MPPPSSIMRFLQKAVDLQTILQLFRQNLHFHYIIQEVVCKSYLAILRNIQTQPLNFAYFSLFKANFVFSDENFVFSFLFFHFICVFESTALTIKGI